jgi:peptidoglycan/LPS O-acetylase OafA/YrhL
MTKFIDLKGVSPWYAKTNHFECLNGLRAISIIAVVWHHTGAANSHSFKFLEYGYHGVTLFFLISGFLITTLLLKERDRTGKIDLTAFFARRSLRIFPLYYAVLLIYILLVFAQERNTEVGAAFFSNLKYFMSYSSNVFVPLDGRVIFYFSWSLAAEEQFYLLMAPLLAFFDPKKAFVMVVTVALSLVALNVLGIGNPTIWGKMAPMGIWLGTASAFLLREKRMAELLKYVFVRKWSAWLLIVLTLYLLETQVLGEAGFVVSAAFMLVAFLLSPCDLLRRALSHKFLSHIGTVSYGIYLLHMICKAFVGKALAFFQLDVPKEMLFVLVLLFAVAVATVSFNSFERYFLAKKVKFER